VHISSAMCKSDITFLKLVQCAGFENNMTGRW
jgi:hypothetical protein